MTRYTVELAENENTKALGLKMLGCFIVDNVEKTIKEFYSLEDLETAQIECNRLNTTVTTQLCLPVKATRKLRVFSFGGGVQSTAVLVLQAQGKIAEPYDVFVFSNVGEDSENPATLEYLEKYTIPFCEKHGIRFEQVRKYRRDGTPETVMQRVMKTDKSICIPARMGGNGAPGRRQCTTDFKIKVIDKWCKAQDATHIVVGLGISIDEWERAHSERWHDTYNKKPMGFWKKREHVLIDLRLRRDDCKRIIEEAGLPVPPKSSCFFCPFQKRYEWQELKRKTPDLFEIAVKIENHINHKREHVLEKDKVYLHPSLTPLEHAVSDQLRLPFMNDFDDMEAEACGGYCHT